MMSERKEKNVKFRSSRCFSQVSAAICLQCRRPRINSRVRKIPWKRDRIPTPAFLAHLVKNLPAMWETWV